MSYKNTVYLILLTLSLCGTESFSMDVAYTSKNTQFAFDFHDVVVQHNTGRISRGIFSRNFVYKIHFNRCFPGLLWALASTAYHDFKGGTGEQYIKILQDYKQPEIAQLVLDIANDVHPIEGTVVIMQELKNLGYEVNMASDIGTMVLEDLKKRPQYQGLLSLFAHEKSVDYLNASGRPVKKPQLGYFRDYLERFQKNKEYVIFIDDKEKNVIGARASGMIGITFKNPELLREELVKMGILE